MVGPPLRGVSATLGVGTEFAIVGEELGKEFACWKVNGNDFRGYVLMNRRVAVDH
jgi:hypothetical protein